MSYVADKCFVCEGEVIFDENPYDNPLATRYWQSSYENYKEEDCMFVVIRNIPTEGKRGKMIVRTFRECITKLYCGPECGLKDYDKNRN